MTLVSRLIKTGPGLYVSWCFCADPCACSSNSGVAVVTNRLMPFLVCRGLTCWCLMFDLQTQPCLSGGECSVTFNDFTCSCPEEFTGKTCETRVWCVSDPCVNGGRCVDLPDGYECKNCKDSHYLSKLPRTRNAESLSEARSRTSYLRKPELRYCWC